MEFKVGDTVVYPHHGAATIQAIEMRTVKGTEKEYLVLKVSQGDLTVKVPAGSRDGQILRVRGRGIAHKSGTGDLKVTLRVATPPAGMAEAELAAYDDALRAAGFDPRSGWAGSA